MVYWGTTAVPPPPSESVAYQNYQAAQEEYQILLSEGDGIDANAVLNAGLAQAMVENAKRDHLDFMNAAMLGYDSTGLIGTDYGAAISRTAFGVDQRDQVAEIEEHRYFVVLMAYDFQLVWKQKKHKLLWETRFSINEGHNRFDKALPVIAAYASQFFGQSSNGLLRTQVLQGRVEVGEVKSLGEVEEPKK